MSATAVDPTQTTAKRQFDYLPLGLFGSVMELTGLSVAWRLAQARYGVPASAADGVAVAAAAAFILVTFGYLLKLARSPHAVLAEFAHPIAGNLFSTILVRLQECHPDSMTAPDWRWRA